MIRYIDTIGVPKLAHDDEDDNEMEDVEDKDVRRPRESIRISSDWH